MEACKFCTVAFEATHRDIITLHGNEAVSICPPCQVLIIRSWLLTEGAGVLNARHTAIPARHYLFASAGEHSYFKPTDDNPDICRLCGSHRGNHAASQFKEDK